MPRNKAGYNERPREVHQHLAIVTLEAAADLKFAARRDLQR
jgi:hypothetical protein